MADHVKQVQNKSGKAAKVATTGHSLGGGLAHIVGALTRAPAVSFSPPGIMDARHTYDYRGSRVTENNTYHHFVGVLPAMDMVPTVDRQAGAIQHIRCTNGTNILECHMLEGTICELIMGCGDRRFKACEWEMAVTNPIKVHVDSWRDFFHGDGNKTTGWQRFIGHKMAVWELQARDTLRYAESIPDKSIIAAKGAQQWARTKIGA